MDGQTVKHLRDNNTNYLEHLVFAVKIGMTLLFRGAILSMHALCPVCDIPKKWNLEDTAQKLNDWSNLQQERKSR
jgi:hypothetical protein